MSNLNLEDILGDEPPTVGRTSQFTPEVAKARRAARTKRNNQAAYLALRALKLIHPADYKELRRQALVKIDAKNGPLPGDE